MKYSMSLNSHWIQKYQPSKLNVRKNIGFTTKNRCFFDRSILTVGIFGSIGSSETDCTSFLRSNQALLESKETLGMTALLPSVQPLRKRPFYTKKSQSYIHPCANYHPPLALFRCKMAFLKWTWRSIQ